MVEINGKHILVTGGSSGFGRHFARFLADEGAGGRCDRAGIRAAVSGPRLGLGAFCEGRDRPCRRACVMGRVARRGEEEVHGVIEQRGSAPGAVAGSPAKYPKVVVMTLVKTEHGWRSLLNGGLAVTAHHGIPFGSYSSSRYHWTPGAYD